MKKIFFLVAFIVFLGAGCDFLTEPVSQENKIQNSILCNQLYEMKKERYWDNQIGQNGAVYNPELDKCLVYNINNDSEGGHYYAFIIDAENNEKLLSYSSFSKGLKDINNCNYAYESLKIGYKGFEEKGCDLSYEDEMFKEFCDLDIHVSTTGYECK